MAAPRAAEANRGVGVQVLARLFDLTPRRIQQLSREGIIPKASHGHYSLPGAVHAYVTHLRQRLEEKQVAELTGSTPELQEARQRKAQLEADLLEIDLAKARGAVCSVEDFDAALYRVATRLNARLDALPNRAAPVLVALASKGMAATVAALEDVVQELKAELRELDMTTDDADDDTAAAA